VESVKEFQMNDAVIVDVVRTASGKGKPGGVVSRSPTNRP
jgi:hypothetical protein